MKPNNTDVTPVATFEREIKRLVEEEKLPSDFVVSEYNDGRCLGICAAGAFLWGLDGKAYEVSADEDKRMKAVVWDDDNDRPMIVDLLSCTRCRALDIHI